MEQGERRRVRIPGQQATAAPLPGPASRSGGGGAARSGEAVPARGEHVHDAPARPLPERHSLRDQVLRSLRNALVGGELRPGAVYSAPALAERFGVSATPVREAMQQLAREGAVVIVHNRGFRIAERTARDLAELGEVRALIEIPALLRLARTEPAGHWQALRPLAQATVEAAARGRRAEYAAVDRAFHRALLEPYGNARLAEVAEELHRRTQGPPAAAPGARLVAEATEHLVLLDALAAGDVAGAESLLRAHLTGGG